MMSSVLLFVTLCMVLMEVIPSSQLPAEDNEMFAFQDGQSGDGPPGKRDVSFVSEDNDMFAFPDGQSGDGPPGKRDVRFVSEDNDMFAFPDGQSGDGPPGKRDVRFVSEDNDMFAFPDGQSGVGPPGKRDVSYDGQSGDGPPGKRDVSDVKINSTEEWEMINCAIGSASSQSRPTRDRDRQRQLTDAACRFVVSFTRDITEEWLRMKTPSGTGGGSDAPDNQPAASSSTQTYGIFKLPGKQEKCCTVCSKISLQSGGKMKRSRTACVKCNKA
ncbi:hypothetical protein J6590_104769 [Homalodisca vitripennis]|nr:hypothetical protein J6590_104769 [Homalodisca vitripennis]